MKSRLFLSTVALVAGMTADVLAQVGGGGSMPTQPNSPDARYAAGYRSGWNDARNRSAGIPTNRHASDPYKDGYYDGYHAEMASRGHGSAGYGSGGYGSGGYGMMNPLAALGQYNLSSSMAATNYQQAYQESIQNQKQREQTYFDERRMNASYRAEQDVQHQRAPPEEQAAFNRARLSAELSANQFDPARGVIEWPGVLNRPEFGESRTQIEGLFRQAAADPHGSGLGTRNYRDIKDAVDEMSEKLHSEIAQFKPNEYIPASKFLKSLVYHGSHLPPAEAQAQQ